MLEELVMEILVSIAFGLLLREPNSGIIILSPL